MVADGEAIGLFPPCQLLIILAVSKVYEPMTGPAVKPVVMHTILTASIAVVTLRAMLGAVKNE